MGPVVAFSGVRKSLAGREILRGISFAVEGGDIFGYLGPNGAGKTTTIRVLLGLLPPEAGVVELFGRPADREARARVGFVLENDGLVDGLSAAENLRLFARLYGVRAPRIRELLERVGLGDRARERVGKFSRGMRQRLALARALLHEPELLVLDEPTAGLDPTGQMEVRDLIRDLAAGGKTVFLSSHNLDEVERLCNRIALIHRGEIRLQGEVGALVRDAGRGFAVELTEPPGPEIFEALRSRPALGFAGEQGKTLLFEPEQDMDLGELATALEALGLRLEAVRRARASLEELYRRILEEAER